MQNITREELFLYYIRLLNDGTSTNPENNKKNNSLKREKIALVILGVFGVIVIFLIIIKVIKKCRYLKAFREIRRINEEILCSIEINDARSSSEISSGYNEYNRVNKENNNEEIRSSEVDNTIENEQKIEELRKKYGNSILIKYLLEKTIIIDKYESKYKNIYDDICTICLEKFVENSKISITPCEHIFHKNCLLKYFDSLNKKEKILCPNCNQNILLNKKYLKLKKKVSQIPSDKKMDNFKIRPNSEIEILRVNQIKQKKNISKVNNKKDKIVSEDKKTINKKNSLKEEVKIINNCIERNEIIKKFTIKNRTELDINDNDNKNENKREVYDTIETARYQKEKNQNIEVFIQKKNIKKNRNIRGNNKLNNNYNSSSVDTIKGVEETIKNPSQNKGRTKQNKIK